jgi:multiple sugar transport system permease protein
VTTSPPVEALREGRATGQAPTTRNHRDARALALFTAPAVLWFFVFMIGPLVSVFYLSLLDWPSFIFPRKFVGIENYVALFQDPLFFTALKNSLIQVAVALPIMITLAFMLGYFLSLRPPGYRVLGVIFFTPALVSYPARAMMFLGLYHPEGIVNTFLSAVGLDGLTTSWLANGSTALMAVIAIDLWAGIGFTAVLFATRLSGMPDQIAEAAGLDGAGHWQIMWRIAFPVVRDFVGVLAMLQFLWILLASAQNILLLTEGGPGNSSMTLAYLLYDQAFVSSQIGYSQAVGVVLFLFGLAGMLLIRRIFRPAF